MRIMDDKVVLIIGGEMWKDLKEMVDNPKKAEKEPRLKIYVESVEQLSSILSAKKMGLLQYIQHQKSMSIGEIASKTNRKQEAVSRDLHQLEHYGLVSLGKKGKHVFPEAKAKKITIEF